MTEDEKFSARKIAIQTAERLSLSERSQNTSLGTGIQIKPTVSQILAAADIIYNWLINEEK